MRPKIRKKKGLKKGQCKICHKTNYVSFSSASRTLMFIWGSDPKADTKDLHVYKCPKSEYFHIGHKSKYKMKEEKKNE